MKVKNLMVILKGIFTSFDDCDIISLNQHYTQSENNELSIDYETVQIFVNGNTINVVVDKDCNIVNIDEIAEKRKDLTIS
jgi:hypothetical protein